MIRDVLAVLAGYACIAIGSVLLLQVGGINPDQPAGWYELLITIPIGALFSVLGGFVAASISKNRKRAVSYAVAILLTIVAITSTLAQPDQPHWTQMISLFVFVPGALFGGWLKFRRP